MQLDATLRSFLLHCQDAGDSQIRVLYATSGKAPHPEQYRRLEEEFANYPFLRFVRENDFRSDCIALPAAFDYVCFLVDDNLFVRDFSLAQCLRDLEANPQALGYSLRLGRNTTYCYPFNRHQRPPTFRPSESSALIFRWTDGDLDFGYPLELSSSIYRTRDVLPFLTGLAFSNPNHLEVAMDEHKDHYRDQRPLLLCAPESITFCAPMNKVQSICPNNRVSSFQEYTADRLAQLFDQGYRINVDSYAGFRPNACHQEVEYRFRSGGNTLLLCNGRPLVSVIIPCYNQAEFLPDAVESVVHQTFTDWECIIVNDGSPDQTSRVARDLIVRHSGKQIRLLEKKNGGLADARNAGITASHGCYILPLDADDALKPFALARLVEVLETQSDVAIVYPDYETCGTQSRVIRCIDEHLFLDAARLKNGLPSCSGLPYCSLYRRDVWAKVGGYNPNMIWGYEDWDFWIGCIEKSFRARRVPEPLFLYRVKPGSMYSNALKHDAELKARIILNHSALFDEAVRQKAETVLQTPVTSGRPPQAIPTDAQPTAAPSPPEALGSKWPPEVTTHVRQADAHFLEGDLPAARDSLRKALVVVPRDPQLIIAYGNIVLRLGDAEDARREFVKATVLVPEHAPAHLNLAGVLLILGRAHEAETSVRRALALSPGDTEALKLLGRICFEAGHHVEGAKAYTEALRSNPNDVDSLLMLGKWAFEMGNRVTAQGMYERALQINPNNQVARESLDFLKEEAAGTMRAGQLPVVKNAPLGSWQPVDQLHVLLVVHGFPPKSAAGTELYAYALAQELCRRGHTVRVLCPEYGSNQVEGTITNEVYEGLEVARIHVSRGDFISQFNNERLLPALRRYVADLSVDLVHIHHLIGISASAPQVFAEQTLPIVMTVHDGWLLCEQCHFLRPDGTFCNDGPETVDKCVHCLIGRSGQSAQSERLPEIFYILALRRQFLQKVAGLIDTFIVPSQFMREKLSRHGFDHPRIILSPLGSLPFQPLLWQPSSGRLRFTFLGNICFTKGLDLAVRAFNLVDQEKARLDLYGRVQDAVYFDQVMSNVTPRHQVKYHGPYSPADLPRILAETDVAVIPSRSEHYPCIVREALQAGVPVIAPNIGGVPEILQDGEGGLLFKPGDYEDLATKFRFFISNPSRVTAFRQRVRPVRTIEEDADQLEPIYRDVMTRRSRVGKAQVSVAPSLTPDLSVWLCRADECAAKGDWAAAHDALKAALDQVPNDPQIIVAFGNVKLRLGDVEAARLEFTKAAALAPEYSPAFSNLAAVLLHLGCLEEAEAAARRAVALSPGDTDALKVLARLCLDSERYAEAVQAYVTILRHTPDDVETLLILASCYAEVGRLEDARALYQRVLQLDPHNAVANENLVAMSGNVSASDRAISTGDRPSDFPSGVTEAPATRREPLASIVIVTYNSARTIRACLDSVLQCTQSPIEVIVVDNASTDETRTMLAEYQGRVTVLLNAENRGFSRGCNQGIRASHGPYVVLLNPDTVVTSGWLDRIVPHFGPDVGAVGPVSDYVAGLQKVSLYLPEQRSACRGLAEAANSLARLNGGKTVETGLLIGFCMVLPRKVLDEVGLLDEELFLGNDDLDLSWRLRLKGYRLLVATDAFVHHEGQVSFKSEAETKTSRLVQESTDRLYAKLEAHYGKGNVPDPMELWGINWFKPTTTHFRPKDKPAGHKLASIIILTHNGLEHTEKCLASIDALTPEPHELIIVDNASTDGTLDFLRDYMASHANVRVIANLANRGFAAGNNQGLVLARGDYVLLLNNDTIVTQGWLRRMVAVLERHPEVGIIGPMSNYVSGPQLVRDASYTTPEELARFSARWAAAHAGQSVPITRVVGFCLLARKQVIERIGGLDEQFGSGNFEDDDFCIRAAQVGYAARIAQDVFIHHTGSQTFKAAGIDYRESLLRNWGLFKTKWGIPADSPYEQGYHVPLQPPPGLRLHVPLPDLSTDHHAEAEGRWWQEISARPGRSQPAVTEQKQLSVVIVPNGHGLATLWPSLVQHTNRSLAITILPSAGNGNGSDPEHQPTCPEGWQVRIGELPNVRLLNQLLESSHDDPVIVLSNNLMLTPGWLKRLLAALKRDQRLAAVGPTSNQGATPQRVKAEYKGTGKALRQFALRRAHRYGEELAEVDSLTPFCIVFNPAACRLIGPLREDLDLMASLRNYFVRFREAGHILAVALDTYVHCEHPGFLS